MYAKLGDRKFRMIEHGNKKEGRKKAANIALLQLQCDGKIPKPVRYLCIYLYRYNALIMHFSNPKLSGPWRCQFDFIF